MADSWSSFFKKANIHLQKSIEEISLEILEEWREIIWKEFYLAYPNPKSYERTYETYFSLNLLKINKSSNGIEIIIGYDDSQIHTSQNGKWISHENPSEMAGIIEYGNEFIYGHDPYGIQAVETMRDKINSPWFKNKFKQLMKEKGYTIKFI